MWEFRPQGPEGCLSATWEAGHAVILRSVPCVAMKVKPSNTESSIHWPSVPDSQCSLRRMIA